MTEQFTNNAITTLNGGIGSGDTFLVVASATLFPASPQFRIIIDSEIMLVTSVSGTTFFVTRGTENTTAAAHLSGASVEHILTAAAVKQAQADVVGVGTFANRPAAGLPTGSLYYTTDGPTPFAYDGSNWRPVIMGTLGTAPPAASSWTQVNQAGRTTAFVDYKGGIRLSATNGTTGVDIRLAYKAAPSAHWQMTAHILPANPNTVTVFGTGFRNSSTGTLVTIGLVTANPSIIQKHKLTANNTGSSPTITQNSVSTPFPSPLITLLSYGYWLRIKNDGTNIFFYYSIDGINFAWLDNEALATFIGTADQGLIHIFYSDANQQDFSAVFDSILFEALP
jgi:hypothetical protein